MTLVQISSLINREHRFKLHPDQYALFLDAAQKLAFDEDLVNFKNFLTLTIHHQLNYASAATAPDANDIGQTATGQTSGATGVVVGYDTGYIYISSPGTFTTGEQVTAPTGLDITLEASSFQVGYKGPYSYPTSTPVRKMIGVTTVTNGQIFGFAPSLTDYDPGISMDDYDPRKFYQPGTVDEVTRTYTFANNPSTASTVSHRWHFFRDAPTISNIATDDANLLIPSKFHFSVGKVASELASAFLKSREIDVQALKQKNYGEWWKTLKRPYTPMGKASNRTSRAQETTASHWS